MVKSSSITLQRTIEGHQILPIDDFTSQVIAAISVREGQKINVIESLGRVLSEDIIAQHTSPYTDLSSIDGYAVMVADLEKLPCTLSCVGESKPCAPYLHQLKHGQAVRIFTGAPIPANADKIIPLEATQTESDKHVTINKAPHNDEFIYPQGIDFTQGDIVLRRNSVMNSRDVGLCGAMDVPYVPVASKANIGVVIISDESAMLGDASESARVLSSSSLAIHSFIEACGANVTNLGVLNDAVLSAAQLREMSEKVDLLITIGGMSTTSKSVLRQAFEFDSQVLRSQVSLNNIEHVLFDMGGAAPALSLPGDLISLQICAALFLRPAIEKMLGLKTSSYENTYAILGRNLDVNDVKMDYIFSKLVEDSNKHLVAQPASSYDRLLISALANSDCLIKIEDGAVNRGDLVRIIRFTC